MDEHRRREEEDEEEKGPQAGYGESLEHHQIVVGHVAVQLALVRRREGGPREALVVSGVSARDGALIDRIVDDVSTEQADHQEERQDEQGHPHIGDDHLLCLLHSDRNPGQLHEGEDEQHRSKEKTQAHGDEEEGQYPCIVVGGGYEAAK